MVRKLLPVVIPLCPDGTPYRPANKPTPSDIVDISKEGNESINRRLFVDKKN